MRGGQAETRKMNELAARKRGGRTFLGVQALRGFAACVVVVHHATLLWAQRVIGADSNAYWPNGAAGVDIFFVISGFVMAVSTIGREHKTHPAGNFMMRRIIRVVPIYWMLTSIFLLKLEVLRRHPEFANGPQLVQAPLGYILSSFFFIPYRNSYGHIQPLLIVGWTLSYEMFFYVLFAIALALRFGVVRVLTPVLVLLAIAGMFRGANWPAITVLADPLLLEFLAGLLLGHFVVKGFRSSNALFPAMALVALPVLLFVPLANPSLRILEWGLPAYLIVQAVVLLEDRIGSLWPRWTLLIGNASYSLYLSHLLVFAVLIKILTAIHLLSRSAVRVQDEAATVLICLVVSVAVSIPLYLFVEKPITNVLRRRILREGPPKAEMAVAH